MDAREIRREVTAALTAGKIAEGGFEILTFDREHMRAQAGYHRRTNRELWRKGDIVFCVRYGRSASLAGCAEAGGYGGTSGMSFDEPSGWDVEVEYVWRLVGAPAKAKIWARFTGSGQPEMNLMDGAKGRFVGAA